MTFRGKNIYTTIGAICFVACSLFQCGNQENTTKLPKHVDFNFDVRPILVQNCYLCHGPDPSSRKADLRLDTFEGATALRDEGKRAIVPGSPNKSELVWRISHTDPEIMMPPPESNLKLSNYDVAVLKKWIDQGAEWKPHWAFIPPTIKEPEQFDTEDAANEIDNYLLEKMELKGLKPAPLASKHTLIRRVAYILTGLPPTPEEITAFSKDDSPEAYEKMVDQYLNTSAFGERWARHWMDIVRYAETKGHEFDYTIMGAWRYRDYLIRAFNQDVSYPQLVKEHLAGDLMDSTRWNPDNNTNESQIGTLFYALSEGTHSPVDVRKDEADRIDNIIDVTSKTFQGLTVSCARCHDHKFDPIPTADYYSMYGLIESSRFSPVPANFTKDKAKSHEEILQLKKDVRSIIANALEQDDSELKKMGQKSMNQADGADDLNFDYLGDFRGNDLDGWKSDGMAFGQYSTLGDPEFSNDKMVHFASGKASSRMFSTGIYGALRSPNFTIDKDFIGVYARGNKATIRIIVDNFQLIQNPIYGGLDKKVNSETWKQVIFNIADWKGHKAYIEFFPGTYQRHVYNLPKEAFIEAEYAIAFDEDWPENIPIKASKTHENPSLIANWLERKDSPQEVALLNDFIQTNKKALKIHEAEKQQQHIEELSASLRDSVFFIGINDGFGINSHVFNRGNHADLSEEEVPRHFLSAWSDTVSAFNSSGSGRMEFADEVLNPNNPLTDRVMVNRIWHYVFGKGIVPTVDNFGLQGKLPSHPELLDYLAIQFQKDGGSIKTMIKMMVMSKAFQREVAGGAEAEIADPQNILLTHFPLRRLEAEAIRDGLLASAGNLNQEMYGPPVPVHLTDFMQGRGRPGTSGPLDGNGRRSIYQEVRRNFLEPMMLTFDRPIPFSTFGNRNVTNVPAQSLILMNDPFVLHQAEVLAKASIIHEKSNEERIKYIYIKTLSREPLEEELQSAKAYIKILAQSYGLNEAEGTDSLEVWKDYCHSVYNLKEFIYLI